MADWEDWQEYYVLYAGNRRRKHAFEANLEKPLDSSSATNAAIAVDNGTSRGVTGQVYATAKTGILGVAIRTFLTAYCQRVWGLEGADLSQSKLAVWLQEQGYDVTLSAIKNASRSALHEHVSPATNEVMAFLKAVKKRFPGLEAERFLARV